MGRGEGVAQKGGVGDVGVAGWAGLGSSGLGAAYLWHKAKGILMGGLLVIRTARLACKHKLVALIKPKAKLGRGTNGAHEAKRHNTDPITESFSLL